MADIKHHPWSRIMAGHFYHNHFAHMALHDLFYEPHLHHECDNIVGTLKNNEILKLTGIGS